ALFIITFKRKKLIKLVYAGILFLLSIPISYLILPLFHHSYLPVTFAISWLVAGLIAGLLYNLKTDTVYKIMIISLATVGLLLIDQIFGAKLIKASPLGYDTISGARFYGIGNEYMGILIGGTCTGCSALLEKTRHMVNKGRIRPLIFLIPILTIIILAYPSLGANVGGTISAGIAFASLFILSEKRKIRIKNAIYIGIFASSLVIFAFLIDSTKSIDSQSHMGQTINLVRQNGLFEISNIIKRKISMNIRLFRYTIWTRVFILSLLSMGTLLFRPVGVVREVSRRYPVMAKGLGSGIIGSVAALLTNDSGIVAAATSIIFVALPFIMLVCDYLRKQDQNSLRGGSS
ncbi:MAG TPA: hypothetical protein VFD33_01890, partial [Bacillota bacterium]|nr:hypothetical protein [Bacillota bacterium]